VGETILKSVVGNNVQEYTFKKKNHLVTMGQKKSIKVDGLVNRCTLIPNCYFSV